MRVYQSEFAEEDESEEVYPLEEWIPDRFCDFDELGVSAGLDIPFSECQNWCLDAAVLTWPGENVCCTHTQINPTTSHYERDWSASGLSEDCALRKGTIDSWYYSSPDPDTQDITYSMLLPGQFEDESAVIASLGLSIALATLSIIA